MTITYLHPPRDREARRLPDNVPTAAAVLGVPAIGLRPTYRGGLKAHKDDRRAHRAYRKWHALRGCSTCEKTL